MRTTKQFSGQEKCYLQKLIFAKSGFSLRGALLLQAFTRRSYASEWGGEDNEILEKIGDEVLGFYVGKIICEFFGGRNADAEYSFKINENLYSGLKQSFISNQNLARIIDEWGVIDYIIVGKNDLRNNVAEQPKIKADLFEAILGAIAVACDWNAETLENAVRKMLSLDEKLKLVYTCEYKPIEVCADNAINTLKELSEKKKCSPPIYKSSSQDDLGYDEEGYPICSCTCGVSDWGLVKVVFASSIKLAKKYATYLVLCAKFDLKNEYGKTDNLAGVWHLKNNILIPYIK